MKFVNPNRFIDSLTYYQMIEFSFQLSQQMRYDVLPDFECGILFTEFNHFIELKNPSIYLMVEAQYTRVIIRDGLYPTLSDVDQKIQSIRIFETKQDQDFHMVLLELEDPIMKQVCLFN